MTITIILPIAAVIVAFLVGFVAGGFVGSRDNPVEHAPDGHAEWLGADAGFSIHSREG